MEVSADDRCICGHKYSCHSRIVTSYKNDNGEWGPMHEFKLDNLSYVEKLAKERGLV
jgi:hypothetical protein